MIESREVFEIIQRYGVVPSAQQLQQMRDFTKLLLKWNQKVNLTRIVDERGIYALHFGESFFLARFFPDACKEILDVGSGCGFPGLALKLLRPAIAVTLLEPAEKKALFLREVVLACGLALGTNIVAKRLEELDKDTTRKFDVITVRGLEAGRRLLFHLSNQARVRAKLIIPTSEAVAERVQRIKGNFGGWSQYPLPNSKQRVVLVGELVPRETSQGEVEI